jgi:hypothetical protein
MKRVGVTLLVTNQLLATICPYLCCLAMCGITGAYAFSDSGRLALTRLQAATDAIVRRGPDSQGHFVYDQCGLGFRRLAILDL